MELKVHFVETNEEFTTSFDDIQEILVVDDTGIGKYPWSSKNTVDKLCPAFEENGDVVQCEPVEGYPLSVTAEDGATIITRSGKNMIDYTQAVPRTTGQVVNIIENGVEWSAGNHYFKIPCNIKAGSVVAFSCLDESGSIEGATLYNEVGTTRTACSDMSRNGKGVTATADANMVYIYKKNPATQIATPIVVTDLQLEYGSVATAYEPYKEAETFAPGETILGASGVNVIRADIGEITVTGRADPVAFIEKLTNAVLSLGGNI